MNIKLIDHLPFIVFFSILGIVIVCLLFLQFYYVNPLIEQEKSIVITKINNMTCTSLGKWIVQHSMNSTDEVGSSLYQYANAKFITGNCLK